MGLFLSMAGVVGTSQESVVTTLRSYAEERAGFMDETDSLPNPDDCLVISERPSGVTVLYPDGFFDGDAASQVLSERLASPTFSFHIHDGDLWMFQLFEDGKLVDRFNPVTDYWGNLDPRERLSWQGNVTEVASRVPGLEESQIANYLVAWGKDIFESIDQKKAYPTDQYHYGDDWQLVDFMRKVGFDYPVAEDGTLNGDAYRFRCEPLEGY